MRANKRNEGEMKLGKVFRKNLIIGVISRMAFDDVVSLECAIQGHNSETIERQIGSMSSNQWRACLETSLTNLIWK
jgi:hypothetical protein